MMDSVNEQNIKEVVFTITAQVGKTEIFNNILGYFIHQDLSPILLIQSILEMAESWSKTRFALMIIDTKVLTELIGDSKAIDSGNTLLPKLMMSGRK